MGQSCNDNDLALCIYFVVFNAHKVIIWPNKLELYINKIDLVLVSFGIKDRVAIDHSVMVPSG